MDSRCVMCEGRFKQFIVASFEFDLTRLGNWKFIGRRQDKNGEKTWVQFDQSRIGPW